jgi:hypothetical protein
MKTNALAALLSILATASIDAQVFTQATIDFDNSFNTNLTPNASSEGAVFSLCPAGLADRFNLQLFGGASPNNLSLIATLLQSNDSALTGSEIGAPGQWVDGTGQTYFVPGVQALGIGYFQVFVWEGDQYSSFADAEASGTPFFGESAVFQNPTGGGTVPPADLTGMPSFAYGPLDCPEPATVALCGLGSVSLLLLRRRKSITGL